MFTEPFAKGLGDRGTHVLDALRQQLARDAFSFPAIAVDYPAVAVAFGPQMNIEIGTYPTVYTDSVAAGVRRGVESA